MKRRPAAVLFAVVLAATTSAHAAATPRDRCIAGKRALTGKAASALLTCDAKAAKAGVTVDPDCELAATTKFQAAWTALEARFPPDSCAATGNQPDVEALVADEQSDLETTLVVSGTPSSCTSSKFRTAGKAAACGLKCASKAVTSATFDLAGCRAKCTSKLAAKFLSADTNASCRTTGDGATVGPDVDTFVGDAINLIPPAATLADPCSLPGSVQFTSGGTVTVPGGDPSWPSLAFLHLPDGFCAHYYATVGNARQLRFAPGGELFVASPTRSTTGGGANGRNAIVVVPDDDADGVGDAQVTYESGLSATQGLMFLDGYLYYQDDIDIRRVPYASGDRSPSGPSELVATIDHYSDLLHWPKPIDAADDGTIYVGNGGTQNEICQQPTPFHGGILKLDTLHGTQVATGMRNPIVVRCSRGHNRCFALELAKDYSGMVGGREKMVPIHDGDDWGFPCCATTDVPYGGSPDCSTVTTDTASFTIGDTPFGLDFAPASWPAPYPGSAFISLHGEYAQWKGAGIVTIGTDAMTGLPLPASDLMGFPTGAMTSFATGWGDLTQSHGRPADLTFAPDGRLFLANDNNGVILWISPMP